MKVFIISIVPSPYQRDLFKALSHKVDLSVFYLEPESPDSPWPRKSLADYESILPGTYFSFRGMRFLMNWRIPDLKGADFVILNGYVGFVFQWLLRNRPTSYKYFFWGERMSGQTKSIKGKVQQWLTGPLKNCSAIVGIGSKAATEYRTRFPSLAVFNIPYYCDLAPFQQLPLKKELKTINLLFCGQMIYRKGLDVLFKAFDLLSGQYDVALHLVGREAELNDWLALASDESKRRIIYHGFQAPEKLPEFFSEAHVFILPSRYDGWGVVVNQALGAGLPVICSDQVGAGLDLIEEGRNGFRFQSGNPEDLYYKVKNLLDNPRLIDAMAQCSRKKSFELTPEKGAAKWVNLLEQFK